MSNKNATLFLGRELVKRVFTRHTHEIEKIVKNSEKDSFNPFLIQQGGGAFKMFHQFNNAGSFFHQLTQRERYLEDVNYPFEVLRNRICSRFPEIDISRTGRNRLQFCAIAMSYLEEFDINR